MGLDARKPVWGFVNNTCADQPAHRRSLISAFVIRFVKTIICQLATGEISIFWLVPVAEEAGLILALSETAKTGFLVSRPIWYQVDALSLTVTAFSCTLEFEMLVLHNIFGISC